MIALSTTVLGFGNVSLAATSGSQNVTLTNSGMGNLSISGITITGTNSTDFTETNTCGNSLASGASCVISITFKPSGLGPRSATLTMMDNANGVTGSVQMIALTGTGAVTCQSTQNDITNGVQLGLIPPLFATPLHTILQLACNAAAEGNIQRSVIELNGFETEVTSFGKRGIIANSAEQVLLTDANALISQQSH